jgi:hypothetical protein
MKSTKARSVALALFLSSAAVAWALEKQAVTDAPQTFKNNKTWQGNQTVQGDAGFTGNVAIAGGLSLGGKMAGAGAPGDCMGAGKALTYDAGFGSFGCNTITPGVPLVGWTFGAYYIGYPGDNTSIAIRHDTDQPASTLKGVRFIATVEGVGVGSDQVLLRDVVNSTTHATCNVPCAGSVGDNVTCTVNEAAVVAGARLSFSGSTTGSCDPKPAGNFAAAFTTP